MNCNKCGNHLIPGDNFCKGCGSPIEQNNLNQNNGGAIPFNGQQVHQDNTPITFNANQPMQGQQPINPMQQEFGAASQNNGMMNQAPVVNPPQPSMNQVMFNPNQNMGGQPMMSPQPMYNPGIPNNKANTNTILLSIGGVLLIAIVAIVFFVFGRGVNAGSNTFKVNHQGFEFNVPTNMSHQQLSDFLVLTNERDGWQAAIGVASGVSYSDVIASRNEVRMGLESQGVTVNKMEEQTISGSKFLVFEVRVSGTNSILVYTGANARNVFVVEVINEGSNDHDYDALKKVASIVSNATYVGQTRGMKTNNVDYITPVLNALENN